jgi:membrane fusion protein (multidrug efflux system)
MVSATDVLNHSLRRGWFRVALMISVPVVLLLGAGYWYLTSDRYSDTDDAFAQSDVVSVSADVAGRVVAVEVHDNEPVKAGQVLFRIDPSNYQIALDYARAELAAAKLQIDGLRATYREKQAELKEAQDTEAYEQREFDRQQNLLAEHVASQSAFDAARHALEMARQSVASTEQQIANTLAALGGNPDIETADHPLVRQAEAKVEQAQLDLSHTVVPASMDGIVTNVDKLPVGQYLNPATPAFSLVSNKTWIEADYKETDLTHMRAGQKAEVEIDAYPGHTFHAVVQSIGAGTGAEFSVLPSQNASGNWVKVVQRIPVRLVIDNPDPDRPLRAGMSADVTVDTQYQQPILVAINHFLAHFGL